MKARLLILFFLFILAVPQVNAQVTVKAHNISYELGDGEVLVREIIVFENPLESGIHTFDEKVTLQRGRASDVHISGVDGWVNNKTIPTTIVLDFSKSPIYRSGTKNTRTVTLTYATRDFSSEFLLDGRGKGSIFSGNILPPLPEGVEAGDTFMIVKTAGDYQFGAIQPPARLNEEGDITYFMSGVERKVYTGFFVEIQYANYKDEAFFNVDVIRRRLDDARGKAEEAKSSILNANAYSANTSSAEEKLNTSLALINESSRYLDLAEELLEQREFYQAFLATNTSKDLAQKALKAAGEAERDAGLQLQIAINQKISQLENITATTPTPAPPATEKNETPENKTIVAPTVTPPPQVEIEPTPGRGFGRSIAGALILLIIVSTVAVLMSKGRKRKDRLAGVRDFRSISDLKRKSYSGFEEKLSDVKKETTIAGEIRQLSREKEKYLLGLENLDKKKLSGEISDPVYQKEKERFEGHIKELEGKIEALQRELPKKGDLDEKGSSD